MAGDYRSHVTVLLRRARTDDLRALYDVCLRTGDAGGDATGLVTDGDLYGHLYAAPYLLFEPRFAWVAEESGRVAGYVLAALDTVEFESRCEAEWWPPLRENSSLRAGATETDRELISLLHEGFHTPAEVTAKYPSHLHIDLLPSLQGRGVGRRLMATVLAAIAAAGSTGVHLGVDRRNSHALGFYEHLGFRRHDSADGILFTMRLEPHTTGGDLT